MKIGQRRSKQRELILEELKGLTCHPTADELYERVRKRLPNISLGTVYRNLELMADNGVILKIETSGKIGLMEMPSRIRISDVFSAVR